MKLLKSVLSTILAISLLLSGCLFLSGCQEGAGDPVVLTPAQHIAKVWGLELVKAVDQMDALADRLSDMPALAPGNTSTHIQIITNDLVLENLAAGLGIEGDLSFLSDIRMKVYADNTGDMDKLQLLVSMNGQEIITLNALMNLTNYLFYVGAPEINDTYLKLEAGNLITAFVGQTPAPQQIAQLVNAMPDKATLTALLSKYTEIIFSYIRNAESAAITLNAQGISQEVTALSCTFTEKDVINLEKELLTTLKNDEQFKTVYENFVGATENNNAYANFQNTIQNKLNVLNEQNEYSTHPMTFFTYVDAADEIIGFRFAVEESNLYYCNLTDGTNIATEAVLNRGLAGSYSFTGSGTITDGKLNGEYKLHYNDGQFFDADYLKVSVKGFDGTAGAVNLKPTAEFLASLNINMNLSFFTYQLYFDQSSCGLSVVNDGTNLFQFDISTGDGVDFDFDVPENTVDVTDREALEQWLSDSDTAALIEKLREMGAGPLLDYIRKMM